ncbi:MAG: hypothetical protein AAFO06_06840, partial [Cyanobacteria bacterium J06597_16]
MTATIPTQSANLSTDLLTDLRPLWDNAHFFSSTRDPRIAETIETLKSEIASIATACAPFTQKIDAADA